MKTQVLETPQLIDAFNKKTPADSNIMRKMKVRKPVHLKKGQWIMLYE